MRTSKGSLLTSRVRASRFGRLVLDATLEPDRLEQLAWQALEARLAGVGA